MLKKIYAPNVACQVLLNTALGTFKFLLNWAGGLKSFKSINVLTAVASGITRAITSSACLT